MCRALFSCDWVQFFMFGYLDNDPLVKKTDVTDCGFVQFFVFLGGVCVLVYVCVCVLV